MKQPLLCFFVSLTVKMIIERNKCEGELSDCELKLLLHYVREVCVSCARKYFYQREDEVAQIANI